MNDKIITIFSLGLGLVLILTLVAKTTYAMDKDLLKLMPKDTLNGIADQAKNELASCTPFSQHINDNVTLIRQTGATDTCYNTMAGILFCIL